MKSITIISIVLSTILFFSCATGQESSEHYKVLDLEMFQKQMELDSNILLVDVRTPEEFELGHISGAVNIDFKNPNFSSNVQQLDTNKKLYIYCRSGNRSSKSSSIFLTNGFGTVHDLKGGYLNYQSGSKKSNNEN